MTKKRPYLERGQKFDSPPPVIEDGNSLAEFAYKAIRQSIREGLFKPGVHLPEVETAEWLGISRTPVREAVRRLISEGLLTNGPWNGAVVAKLNLQQLVELYTVREWLEGMAVALAARHASEPEIKNLHVINRRELSVTQEPEKLVVVNFEFHHALHCAAHNRYLLQSLSSVVDALGLLQDSTFILPGSGREAHKEHLEIIEAIERRDPDAGEQLVRQHVRHALEIRLQLLTREFRDTG